MSQMIDVSDSMAARSAYLEQHLGNVSRSFALVIPFLELPLRHYLATAYLLCRVVDNIEDCVQPAAWKQQRFTEFLQLLRNPGDASAVLSQWQAEAWPALTDHERRIMGVTDGLALWQIYAEMPQSARETVQRSDKHNGAGNEPAGRSQGASARDPASGADRAGIGGGLS